MIDILSYQLFGAGDTVGGSAHKFSSGSFTEGRLAAKAAVKYIQDLGDKKIEVNNKQCEDFKEIIYKPLENYKVGRNEITAGTVSPSYILPIQGLQRLQKIMDEYCGGIGVNYMTNENLLKKCLELLGMLQEDHRLSSFGYIPNNIQVVKDLLDHLPKHLNK